MAKESILIVEDESDILTLVEFTLAKEGYTVHSAESGEAALQKLASLSPNLIVLDLMLPGVDGLEVCRRIRMDASKSELPILLLTAKSEDSDIITGLELGADDYVTKPFSPRVLLARIRNLLRRRQRLDKQEAGDGVIRLHDLELDPNRHLAKLGGNLLTLSATEFAILEFLASNPGWVYTRNRIIDGVKGSDYAVTERSVDVQILGLRKKLGNSADLIETVRGVGYRFKPLET